jgi:hypothetical protein
MDAILVFQKIIEQESKTSTYKFALLRAIIDIISAQSPHIEQRQNQVAIPVFLITDKWLFYYWDLILKEYPQINGERKLVFKDELLKIKSKYNYQNFWNFQKDFQKQIYDQQIRTDFIGLAKSINDTIIKNPVKYIGTSMGQGYNALFQTESGKAVRSSSINGYLDLLANSPKLLMDSSYFEGLKIYGGLLSGTNSIIMNWVDFMEKQRYQNTKTSSVELQEQAIAYGKPSPLEILLQSETMARDTDQIRKFWCAQIESGQPVYCTWSGQQIKKTDDLAIDHAIPFSVLFNNDYWNLLPAKNVVNANKTDKIVSKTQLLASKTRILTTWQQYLQTPALADTFAAQCQISLTKAPNFTTEDLLEKFQEINDGFVAFRWMESWGWGS